MNKTEAKTIALLCLLPLCQQAQQVHFAVESVEINGKKQRVENTRPLLISAQQDDIIFGFTPLDGVQYCYKLEGYDQRSFLSPYPIAQYPQLSGGDYALQVQAIRFGKVLQTSTLQIEIERELAETKWFWPVVFFYALLMLGAGIYFFLLYNFRQKLKVEQLRSRIAADLHDEVGATLSSIAIAARVIERRLNGQSADLMPILDQIKTDSNDTIQSIRDTVWTLNPQNDSLSQLIEKMRSFAFQILTVQHIALQFDNHWQEIKPLKVSMEQRRNIYLIFKEAINNIAKHADASKVNVELSVIKNELKMSITDNGKGFDMTTNYEGNGLKNFKKRAAEGFMDLKMNSKVGQGTRLEVTAP